MKERVRLDSLTGIRFFAAACIVLGHAHPYFGSYNIATNFALGQGVSLFFLLSGFILAYSYDGALCDKNKVKRFFCARFARLYPSHMITAIILLVLIPKELYIAKEYETIIILVHLFLIQSWNPIGAIILSLNGVSWSISTEFFFYLCLPIILCKLKENWIAKLLGFIGILISFLILGNYLALDRFNEGVSLFGVVYTNPLVRIFEFLMGVFTYIFLYKNLKKQLNLLNFKEASLLEVCVVGLLIFSMWITPVIAYSSRFMDLFGSAGALWMEASGSFLSIMLLLLILAIGRGIISKVLGCKIFVWLGEISFAIYLCHTILLKFYEMHKDLFSIFSNPIVCCIFWVSIIFLAHILFKGIEDPMRKIIMCVYDNGVGILITKKVINIVRARIMYIIMLVFFISFLYNIHLIL